MPERAQAELPLPPAGGVQVRAQGDLLLQLLFLLLFPLLLLLLLLLLHLLLLQVGAEGVLLLEAREDAHQGGQEGVQWRWRRWKLWRLPALAVHG